MTKVMATRLRSFATVAALSMVVVVPNAAAFEPIPPIMQTLLKIFPEENGRFVDEPFGSMPQMPEDARPVFETFRVIVPSVDDLERNVARLLAAASQLPIKKITRYDRQPGAPGLAGFRGIWCQTEDESLAGFSILTVNQNRFLIWAKMGYYPAFGVDTINAKVRDQYARDVSQYLAGIDLNVPDNDPPQASGRMLPEWMDLYPPVPAPPQHPSLSSDSARALVEEIRSWGFRGVTSLVPTVGTLDTIIAEAPDTLWSNREQSRLQSEFKKYLRGLFDAPGSPQCLNRRAFDSLQRGRGYDFVVDRFGRIRFCQSGDEGNFGKPLSLFFPGVAVLSTGGFAIAALGEWAQLDPTFVDAVCSGCSPYFWSCLSSSTVPSDSLQWVTEAHLRSVGHFFHALQEQAIPVRRVMVGKFCRCL